MRIAHTEALFMASLKKKALGYFTVLIIARCVCSALSIVWTILKTGVDSIKQLGKSEV